MSANEEGLSGEQKKEQSPETSNIPKDENTRLNERADDIPTADGKRDEAILRFVNEYLHVGGHPEINAKSVDDELLEDLRDQIDIALRGLKVFIDRNEAQMILEKLKANSQGKGYFPYSEENSGAQRSADPITMFNGEFVHETDDIKINGAGIDFTFKRTYRNQVTFQGRLGFKWDHSYNLWLQVTQNDTILRTNGALQDESYIKHPIYDYYVPQNGKHSIIIQNGNDSYIWINPQGDRYIYDRDPNDEYLFRIIRIQDKNGQNISDNEHSNYLQFEYTDDSLLKFITINHDQRRIQFHYDDRQRIKVIEDYTTIYGEHRKWYYTYDDFGDLISVTTPKTNRYPHGLNTYYEYSTSQFFSPILQHNLIRIIDSKGMIHLENEYGTDTGILSFNRVVLQKRGKGETFFEYEDVIQEFEREYTDLERPVHQTNVIERNGRLIHYVYNKFGNLLLMEEEIIQWGTLRLIRWRYRYNADGLIVGVLSPERTMIQYYHGRDYFVDKKRITDHDVDIRIHPELSQKERLAFGNMLAIVRRGKRLEFYSLLSDSNSGVWGNFYPSLLGFQNRNPTGNLIDIITKFTYESDYQQIRSSSDPRYTESADPDGAESQSYLETLTRYEYSGTLNNPSNIRLLSIRYPDIQPPDGLPRLSITQRYTKYDDKGRLKESVDPEGVVTTFDYFPKVTGSGNNEALKEGYLREKMLDPTGLRIAIRYDVNEIGMVEGITQPKGIDDLAGRFRTHFEINAFSQIVKTVSSAPYSYETRSFYDKNNMLEKIERDLKDENGNPVLDGSEIRIYHYDDQNNLLYESVGGNDPKERIITRHVYNESDLLILTILPNGNKIRRRYDERLLQKLVTRGAGSVQSSTTRMNYNLDGLKFRTIDGRGKITSYRYDPFNRLIEKVDPLGNILRVDYDKAGNIIMERFFEKTGSDKYLLLKKSEYEYDTQNHRIIEHKNHFKIMPLVNNIEVDFRITPVPGSIDIVTKLVYDRNGRLKRIINPKSQTKQFEYDNAGRRIKETDVGGTITHFFYDLNGNLIRKDIHEQVLDPSNANFVREDLFSILYKYDELDRIRSVTDALGNITTFIYDSRNMVTESKDPLGNIVRFEYNVYGRKEREVSELTDIGIGIGSALTPLITQFEYDKNGNIETYIDHKFNSISQEFDELDRKVLTVFPDLTTEELQYDKNDNIVARKDNNGLRRIYLFNDLNRIVRMDLDHSNLAPGITVVVPPTFEQFGYDGLQRINFEKNDFSQVEKSLDSFGMTYKEIVKFTTPTYPISQDFTILRDYDVVGNLIKLTYPDGRIIRYHMDELTNNIERIENSTKGSEYPGSTTFSDNYIVLINEYRGMLRSKTIFGNGTSMSYAYDGNKRVIQIGHTSRNGTFTIQQLYDAAGNMRFRNDIFENGSEGEIYKYNSVYWLTNIQSRSIRSFDPVVFEPSSVPMPESMLDGQIQIDRNIGPLPQDPNDLTYIYDLAGNRIKDRQPEEPSLYALNSLNQYYRVDDDILSYDFNGNLTSHEKTRNNQGLSYLYDYKNNLRIIFDHATNQTISEFLYDAIGRRIVSSTNGEVFHFIFDGENVIQEIHDNSVFAQYVNENSSDSTCQMVVKETLLTPGKEYWYHKDLIRSTRMLTDERGYTMGRYSYLPFGIAVQGSGPYNPYLYAGRRFDLGKDLYDFRTRVYAPSLGRFLQRDIRSALNSYVFVNNNPLIFVDPSGMVQQSAQPAQIDPTAPTRSLISRESLFPWERGIENELSRMPIGEDLASSPPWLSPNPADKQYPATSAPSGPSRIGYKWLGLRLDFPALELPQMAIASESEFWKTFETKAQIHYQALTYTRTSDTYVPRVPSGLDTIDYGKAFTAGYGILMHTVSEFSPSFKLKNLASTNVNSTKNSLEVDITLLGEIMTFLKGILLPSPDLNPSYPEGIGIGSLTTDIKPRKGIGGAVTFTFRFD